MGEKKKELKSPVLVSYVESLTEPSSKDEVRKRLVSLEEFTLTKYNTLIDENFLFERLEVESKIVYIFYSQGGDCLHFTFTTEPHYCTCRVIRHKKRSKCLIYFNFFDIVFSSITRELDYYKS